MLCLAGCATSTLSRHAEIDPTAELGRWASAAPFYRELDALDQHQATGPVTILQIGDSHTANDAFSGRMRELLQQRFGDAGRGMLPPGVPFRYYHPSQIDVSANGWTTISAFSHNTVGPWGIALVRQHTDTVANMTVHVDAPGGAGRGWVELLAQPGGGQVTLQADDGGRFIIPTAAAKGTGPLWLRMPTTPATTEVTLTTAGDGPVDVLGWEVERGTATQQAPGILYANLGTIGATVGILAQIDPSILADEMRHVHPSLVIVAFGTNEGFNPATDIQGYPALYEELIQQMHAAAPDAGLVVVLPPDGVHRDKTADPARSCDGLSDAGNGWATPAHLPLVRDAEVAVAARQHWMQWDWRQAMADPRRPDGRCAILDWGLRDPPFAAKDHVHLLKPGYQQTAQSLFDDLMHGYDIWRRLKHPG